MTNLTKGLMSLGFVGAVSGGGILIKNKWTSREEKLSVSKRLENEGYTILNYSVDSDWSTTLTKHKDAQIKHPKFLLNSQELSALKETCRAILSKTDISVDDYKKAKKWCVKPVTIGDLIKSKKLKLLDTTKDDETDKAQWKPLADEYVHKGKGTNQITGLTLPLTSGNRDDDWKQLRTKCKELIAKDFWSDQYEDETSRAIMWCVSK
ncbi:hypothetical protein MHC_01655 [Mycoplasma haemocanis str. Illinois]|uniref:Uncharacterized protein n=1 Tax=Mycoplasma haemocanis (strain Illinois) TaxID=1111676 RepID=H6N6C5_MYCHN|nr:hypothetical protein [Mycoplasma haemocanis]AEW45197.2 hypothetical protein MHC_01655 [Mycoplasma haemocanis str. Illinois]